MQKLVTDVNLVYLRVESPSNILTFVPHTIYLPSVILGVHATFYTFAKEVLERYHDLC